MAGLERGIACDYQLVSLAILDGVKRRGEISAARYDLLEVDKRRLRIVDVQCV